MFAEAFLELWFAEIRSLTSTSSWMSWGRTRETPVGAKSPNASC